MTKAEKEFRACIEILVSPEDYLDSIVWDAEQRLRNMYQEKEKIHELATQLCWEKVQKYIADAGNPVLIDREYLDDFPLTRLLQPQVQSDMLMSALAGARTRREAFNSGVDPV